MAYGTVSADIIQSSVPGVSLGAGNASIMKNRIINGEFKISQYWGATATTGVTNPGAYYIDRFVNYCSSGSVFSLGQNLGSVTPPTGFSNYFGFQNTTASTSTSTQYCNMQHYIEGFNIADLAWGTANAKPITISFWVYSSVTGTYGLAIQNGGSSYGYPTTYTIPTANTWTYVTITVPGPTSGTWSTGNVRGVVLIWDLGQGSTFRFTAGSWQSGNIQGTTGSVNWNQTTNATFYITGVQFEVGSSATGYEYRQLQQELALCQRYFQLGNFQNTVCAGQPGLGASAYSWGANVPLPVTMRAAPTITATYAGTNANLNWVEGGNVRTSVAQSTSAQSILLGISNTGAATSGSAYVLGVSTGTNYLAPFWVTAEL